MRRQVERVAEVLRESGADAVLLSAIPSVGAVSGYWPSWEMWPGSNPFAPDPPVCVVTAEGEATLVMTEYFGAYADAALIPVRFFATYDHTRPPEPTRAFADAVADVLGFRPGRVGIEPHTLPIGALGAVRERVDAAAWADVEMALARTRRVKLAEEVDAIREACAVADRMQRTLKQEAAPGRTDLELATRAIEAAWALRGSRFAILTQLASGPITGSLPSGEPSARVVEEGDLICLDVAPWPNGYWSDTCNGVVAGEPTSEQREAFEVLRAALAAGIAAVAPGVIAHDVDAACRAVVRAAGHDYAHHTGHGVGAEHTESPRITQDSVEVLEAGMVIALEPGIYREGWGGFRHEHVLLVTRDGAEVLTRFDHTL